MSARQSADYDALRTAVARLASRMLKFDVLNEQVPAYVDVPDDYEAGVNEAGRYLRALLDEHPTRVIPPASTGGAA